MSAGYPVTERCEKCGSADVLMRWHGKGSYHDSRKYQACHGDFGLTRGKPKEEHLHYHCRNCQFDWTGVLTPLAARSPSRTEQP